MLPNVAEWEAHVITSHCSQFLQYVGTVELNKDEDITLILTGLTWCLKVKTLGLLKSGYISAAAITGILEKNIRNPFPLKSHIHNILSSELLYIFWCAQL